MSRRYKHRFYPNSKPYIIQLVELSLEDFCLLKKSLGPFKVLLAASHPSLANRAFAKETVEELERKIVAIIKSPVQWVQVMPIDENEMIILQTSLWIYAMQYSVFASECEHLRKKLLSGLDVSHKSRFN